ncbi:HNH endonuclease [Streptomyces xanthophaeus]|uniref:HNH endonuclease n=1 Tax=Streptomyces xanthophaeus TaxID=67385 RepID=UPI0039902F7C
MSSKRKKQLSLDKPDLGPEPSLAVTRAEARRTAAILEAAERNLARAVVGRTRALEAYRRQRPGAQEGEFEGQWQGLHAFEKVRYQVRRAGEQHQAARKRLARWEKKARRKGTGTATTATGASLPAPREAGAEAMGPQQLCPICGRAGLPAGRTRHQRCERASRPDATSATSTSASTSTSTSADASAAQMTPRERPTRGGSIGSSDARARYRQLVQAVEEREQHTRGRRREQTLSRPVRLAAAREAVLVRSEGRCENPGCGGQPADLTDDGRPLLEVDHVVEIATGGRDAPEQMVALCPNCHAIKTRGRTRESLRKLLLDTAARRHGEWTAATPR